MSATTHPTVTAARDDNLDEMLRRLREAGDRGDRVELIVPADSSLLLTAAEFRRLKEVVDRDRLAIEVVSDDALRLQLARLLGVPARPLPSGAARPAEPSHGPRTTRATDGRLRSAPGSDPVVPSARHKRPASPPNPGVRVGAEPHLVDAPDLASAATSATKAKVSALEANTDSLAAIRRPVGDVADRGSSPPEAARPRSPGADTGEANPTASAAAATDVATDTGTVVGTAPPSPESYWPEPPTPEALRAAARFSGPVGRVRRLIEVRTVAPAPDVPFPDGEMATGTGIAGTSVIGPDAEADAKPMVVLPAAERHRRPTLIAVAIVAVALAALLGAFVLLPSAEVTVSLRQAPLAAEVVYDVTASGDPLDDGTAFAVAAAPAQTKVRWEGSVPTTGTRREPDGTADGPVVFANPTGADLTVEAGTTLSTEGGTEFVVAQAVAVPAADSTTGRAGTANGEVRAVDPGSGGNVDVGQIGGQLANGIYYSNRQQGTAGGTDREIRVVSETDLETLAADAAATRGEAALAAFAAALPTGSTVLPATFAWDEMDASFSAAAGDDADTLSMQAVWSVSALAYDASVATDALEAALTDRLGTAAPAGYALDPNSVEIATAEPISEGEDGLRVRQAASAAAVAAFGADERAALAARLTGLDPVAAEAMLNEVPQLAGFRVEYQPGWLPSGMPRLANRIGFVVEP